MDEKITVAVEPALKERLQAEALKRSTPKSRILLSDVVRDLLEEGLRHVESTASTADQPL